MNKKSNPQIKFFKASFHSDGLETLKQNSKHFLRDFSNQNTFPTDSTVHIRDAPLTLLTCSCSLLRRLPATKGPFSLCFQVRSELSRPFSCCWEWGIFWAMLSLEENRLNRDPLLLCDVILFMGPGVSGSKNSESSLLAGSLVGKRTRFVGSDSVPEEGSVLTTSSAWKE